MSPSGRAQLWLAAPGINLILGLLLITNLANSQVSPDIPWRTLTTQHFRVHFSPGLEDQARRAAANAERAYSLLAAELKPPRPPLDLVIADNVDFTNGYATPFPSNRIILYAHPPVSSSSLRFYDEWNALVVTHELTHIFQLDRARGWWRVAQAIFGRSPAVMPNLYTPAWISEGLAVYYESRLTGSGRLVGTEHGMIARATIADRGGPRLDELSLVSSEFPGGQSAYAYGSLLIDYLARTRGPEHVGEFVERISVAPIPFFLNRASRATFGVSLQDAWREFRDSVTRQTGAAGAPMPGWRELTPEGRDALHPRWRSDSTILYAASTGRESPGVYSVDLDGDRRRIARRNSLEPNVPLADGSLVFAQLEFVDPYRVRSDLYIGRGGSERRLTRGARLSHPDARRSDGAIVAVQAVPATTRLVRVSPDGRAITPITSAVADTQWSEPRWSPDGGRIAAVRRSRDGYAEIVVLDTTGATRTVITRSRSIEATPSWSADGRAIYFSSDRTGVSQLYVALADSSLGPIVPAPLSAAVTGLFHPEQSPAGEWLASALFRADGHHIGVASLTTGAIAADGAMRAGASSGVPAPRAEQAPLPAGVRDTSPARRYSPWRTLVPRYWLPTYGTNEDGAARVGGTTSSEDVIGRHGYAAELQIAPSTRHLNGGLSYRYSGFGNPVVGASLAQFSDYDRVFRSADNVTLGHLRERTHLVAISATLRRPRFRSGSSLSIGAELERATFSTRPDSLLPLLTSFDPSPREYAAIQLSGGWANTQRPALSISSEDGISLSFTARQRWQRGGGTPTTLGVGTLRLYKSLNLPGFSHHVIAARASGGWANAESTSDFGIGGTSGSSVEIFPGFAVGDSPRTFPIRGFPGGIRSGLRAAGGSIEYRAPLFIPTRGFGMLPLFFDKLSLTLFGDAAAVWCPAEAADRFECLGTPLDPDWLASAGGELNLDAALPYDVPYRFRFGVAAPVKGREVSDAIRPVSVYVSLGFPF
jgi:hypothetical protein